MQYDAEEGIEDYPTIITISDMHTNEFSIDRSIITANLDIDVKDTKDGDNEESDKLSKKKSASKSRADGVQKRYMKAAHNRLRVELNNKPTKEIVDYWLKNYLKDNNWLICKCKEEAIKICTRLGMNTDDIGLPAYQKSIKVWIPEEMQDIEAMTFYPTCRNNYRVVIDGFEHKHLGRLIVDLCDTYFVMG